MYWLNELFNMLRRFEEEINGKLYATVSSGTRYIQLNVYWSEGYDLHHRIEVTEIPFSQIEVETLFERFIHECNEYYIRQVELDKLDDSQDLQGL